MRLDIATELLARQDGVVSRRQLLGLGATRHDVERWLRRRDLAAVHPGVYVDHTGPPSWTQRARAATFAHPPAALDGASALRAWGVRTGAACEEDPVRVVVAHGRRLDDPPGVRTRVSRTYAADALLHLGPPRIRLEVAVVEVAAAQARPDSTVAVLADAVQSGRTTVPRLRAAVLGRPRLAGRRLVLEVLADAEDGALSALERRYLRDVERAHGLPHGLRQSRREDGGYDDLRYPAYGVRVELDGVLGHSWSTDRWADQQRDLRTAAAGDVTLRAGWRHVLDPCRLAADVARVLGARGWEGSARCPACDRGVSTAPAAVVPPRSA